MSINNLPPELLDSIFEYLPPPLNRFSHSNLPFYSQAYHPLTLVCTRWNEITTSRLYKVARLSRVEEYSAFQQTLVSTSLGQHLKCLRVSTTEWTKETKSSLRHKSMELLASLFFGRYTPNLEELYIAGNQTINLSRLSALKSKSDLPFTLSKTLLISSCCYRAQEISDLGSAPQTLPFSYLTYLSFSHRALPLRCQRARLRLLTLQSHNLPLTQSNSSLLLPSPQR